MVLDLSAAPAKRFKNHQPQHIKDQLAVIKTNLLNPAEVTFCNLSDESINLNRRKRLTTINSEPEDSDGDSIISTSNTHPASTASERERKKKLPDGGYGWVILFLFFFLTCNLILINLFFPGHCLCFLVHLPDC